MVREGKLESMYAKTRKTCDSEQAGQVEQTGPVRQGEQTGQYGQTEQSGQARQAE